MHLTRFSDNALRCLTYLALHPGETVEFELKSGTHSNAEAAHVLKV